MMDQRSAIRDAIKKALLTVESRNKTADKLLKPAIVQELGAQGFQADRENSRNTMERHLPVWRSKDSGQVELTSGRREIDIVVYSKAGVEPIGLIEIEPDLNDLRPPGTINKRPGHNDVYSIPSQNNGQCFESYKSLERMAAWLFYRSSSGSEIPFARLRQDFERLRSDDPKAHNPSGIFLFLVSAKCRKRDLELLDARCRSLRAEILWQRISGIRSSFAGYFFESSMEPL